MAPIFHITTAAEWEAAQAAGSYTGSTRGRTLAEVGFVHCSRGDQWPRVRDAIYDDVTEPLVLLEIDPELLDVPVVEEVGEPGGAETFPHVYGPLPVAAVMQAIPLAGVGSGVSTSSTDRSDSTDRNVPSRGTTQPRREQFGPVFLRELFGNALVLVVLLTCVVAGSVLGDVYRDDGWGALGGLVVGALAGVPLAIGLHRRLQRRSGQQ